MPLRLRKIYKVEKIGTFGTKKQNKKKRLSKVWFWSRKVQRNVCRFRGEMESNMSSFFAAWITIFMRLDFSWIYRAPVACDT